MIIAFLLCFYGYCQNSTLEGKKVLLVYGGWQEGHRPKKSEIISQWLIQEKTEAVVSNSTEIYVGSIVTNSVALVIQSITTSEIKE